MANVDDNAANNQVSDSDDEESLNSNDETEYTFVIKQKIIEKGKLHRLIHSDEPEDVEELNQWVLKIINSDKYTAMEFMLAHRYKVGVMNDKGQTAVHVAFYNLCNDIHYEHYRTDLFDFFDDDDRKSYEILYKFIYEWLTKKRLSVKPVDCNGLTYLHIACFLYDPDPDLHSKSNLIKKCLKNKADVNAQFRDPKGFYGNFTPLHFAILNSSNCNGEIVKHLLTPKLKIDAQDLLGRTALHLACQIYADQYQFRTHNTLVTEPCILAPRIFDPSRNYRMNSLTKIDLLVKSGANVNLKDKNGNTPLLSIFPEKYGEFTSTKEKWHDNYIPIIETTMKFAYLWKNGADMTVSNENGDTVLHLITRNLKACRIAPENDYFFDDGFYIEMIKHIFELKQDVDVNARNKKGITPMQWAVEAISLDVVQLLLSHGANFDHLKFEYEKFLAYPDAVPNFEATKNLITITELFSSKGFSLTPDINLKILKFLIHDVSECNCAYMSMLLYGSTAHIQSSLKQISISFYEDMDDFTQFYYPIALGEFYIDAKVKKIVEKILNDRNCTIETNGRMTLPKLLDELKIIKTIKIPNTHLNLYDLMIRHPYNVPYNIAKNFDYSILKDLYYYKEIIKAHLIKPILRRHVEEICVDSMSVLCYPLTYDCCQIILKYLSNQDIVNVYSIVNSLA